jgi:hypothetical protein
MTEPLRENPVLISADGTGKKLQSEPENRVTIFLPTLFYKHIFLNENIDIDSRW